ncbi:MAG: exosortase-associated EpsI family protein [Capsulimonadaceae bacterium]|nr:exosortase-associated EpsI family protein [Capsulimonadaceae bacterium]
MPEIRRAGYFLIAILAIAAVLSFVWKPPAAAKFRSISENLVPFKIDGYSGRTETVSKSTLEALETAQLIDRQYVADDGFRVAFALIGGTDRDALHDPRSCLIGTGGVINNDRVEMLPGYRLNVRSCDVVYSGEDPSIADIVYFYFAKDGSVASATDIRMRLLSSALLFRRAEPIYFVRFMTPVSGNATSEDRQASHARLLAFASRMWGAVGPMLARKVNHS